MPSSPLIESYVGLVKGGNTPPPTPSGSSESVFFNPNIAVSENNIYKTFTEAVNAANALDAPQVDLYIHATIFNTPFAQSIAIEPGTYDLSKIRLIATGESVIGLLTFDNGCFLSGLPIYMRNVLILSLDTKNDGALYEHISGSLITYWEGSGFINYSDTHPLFNVTGGRITVVVRDILLDGMPLVAEGNNEAVNVDAPGSFNVLFVSGQVPASGVRLFSGDGSASWESDPLSSRDDLTPNPNFTGTYEVFNTTARLLADIRREQQAPKYRAVKACSLTNVSLAAEINILDSVAISYAELFLLAGQSDSTENGIYQSLGSGFLPKRVDYWLQDNDFSHDYEIRSGLIIVQDGTTHKGKIFRNTNTSTITVGVTAITYEEVSFVSQSEPTTTASTLTNCSGFSHTKTFAEKTASYANNFVQFEINVTTPGVLTSARISTQRTTSFVNAFDGIGSGSAESTAVDPIEAVSIEAVPATSDLLFKFIPSVSGIHTVRIHSKYKLS
jgi:hypothetical protein